ncbi:MAG: matrixin family metalloprotease [Proteobacteria bacterium]|nr:MAG: matrixin family metalloprotease [Pseudomonadota bacterium]
MFSKVSIIFLLPSLAWAFTFLTDGMKGWERDEINFHFNPAGCSLPAEEIEAAIDEGIRAWNRVPTAKLRLRYEGRSEQTGQQEEPLIECVTAGLDESLGVTRIFTVNRRIYRGYIQLNSDPSADSNIANYRGERLSIVLAHEMGHALGLGHSASEAALMHYTIAGKQELLLSQDDIDGVSFLYPRKEPEDGMLGCGSLSPPGGGSGGGSGLLGVLSIVGIFTLLLSKRRSPTFPAWQP